MKQVVLAILLVGILTGCSSSTPYKKDTNDYNSYLLHSRTLAPEDAYGRLRWVRAAEVMPSRELPESSKAVYVQSYKLDLKNTPIFKAGLALGAANSYASKCVGPRCTNSINVQAVGTIDDLAQSLATKAKASVSVDHEARLIRIDTRGLSSPDRKLFGEDDSIDTQGSEKLAQ